MTLPIAKRLHRERLPPEAEEWLLIGKRSWWYYLQLGSEERAREFWVAHRDLVLKQYTDRHPGRRPLLWWHYDAPEPRRRLGGTGTPLSECSNFAPTFMYGVPEFWKSANDAHLPFGVPISADDPPTYESEPFETVRAVASR